MINAKKPKIRFGKGGQYTAIFSNIGHEDKNSFYLLTVFISKSKNPVEEHLLSKDKCNELLKRENENYKYKEI